MKNIIEYMLLLCLLFNITFSYSAQLDSSIHMDKYISEEYQFSPDTLSYEFKATSDKIIKKKHKKINKLYKEHKYSDILKIEEDFLPALYSLYITEKNNKNYYSAINTLKTIRTLYPDFNKNVINSKLINDLYLLNQYNETIEEIKKSGITQPYYNYYLSDCYFNLGLYNDAINYANKIKQDDNMYIKAQEILFKCYHRQNNTKEEYIIIKKLIAIDPTNAKHYLRAVSCTNNINEKLQYLYTARNLVNNTNDQLEINDFIILLEQKKIQDIVRNSKKFIETPNWLEIISQVTSYGDIEYWLERQDKFYNATNNCIKNYKEENLSSCFSSIIINQNSLNNQLMQHERIQQENIYRKAILQQNERMIHLQKIQTWNQIDINSNLHNMNNNLYNINNNLRNINYNLQNF